MWKVILDKTSKQNDYKNNKKKTCEKREGTIIKKKKNKNRKIIKQHQFYFLFDGPARTHIFKSENKKKSFPYPARTVSVPDLKNIDKHQIEHVEEKKHRMYLPV